MKNNNIINHIAQIVAQDIIVFESHFIEYKIAKEDNEFIMFFDDNAVVTKLTDGKKFYALKSFVNLNNVELECIYSAESLKQLASEQCVLKNDSINITNQNGVDTKYSVLLCNWLDDVPLVNCNIRYFKQLHNIGSNQTYRKQRRKIKTLVITMLFISTALIGAAKINYPNEIYINPIDYKKLIVADSIMTAEIALNKNKKSPDLDNQSAISAENKSGKSKFIKENTNEVFSILVPEPVKVDKPVVVKPIEKKIIIAPKIEKKVAPKKMKEVDEKELKIIHSKSKVDFKSTEF